MTIPEYLSSQLPERQPVMRRIHEIILKQDKTVTATIEPMMGKEMIIYKAAGVFKYGLCGVKKYMSLHLLPMYGSKTLHAKYQAILKNATFQKGCINFVSPEDMPPDTVKALISDCAPIDMQKIREEYQRAKSKK